MMKLEFRSLSQNIKNKNKIKEIKELQDTKLKQFLDAIQQKQSILKVQYEQNQQTKKSEQRGKQSKNNLQFRKISDMISDFVSQRQKILLEKKEVLDDLKDENRELYLLINHANQNKEEEEAEKPLFTKIFIDNEENTDSMMPLGLAGSAYFSQKRYQSHFVENNLHRKQFKDRVELVDYHKKIDEELQKVNNQIIKEEQFLQEKKYVHQKLRKGLIKTQGKINDVNFLKNVSDIRFGEAENIYFDATQREQLTDNELILEKDKYGLLKLERDKLISNLKDNKQQINEANKFAQQYICQVMLEIEEANKKLDQMQEEIEKVTQHEKLLKQKIQDCKYTDLRIEFFDAFKAIFAKEVVNNRIINHVLKGLAYFKEMRAQKALARANFERSSIQRQSTIHLNKIPESRNSMMYQGSSHSSLNHIPDSIQTRGSSLENFHIGETQPNPIVSKFGAQNYSTQTNSKESSPFNTNGKNTPQDSEVGEISINKLISQLGKDQVLYPSGQADYIKNDKFSTFTTFSDQLNQNFMVQNVQSSSMTTLSEVSRSHSPSHGNHNINQANRNNHQGKNHSDHHHKNFAQHNLHNQGISGGSGHFSHNRLDSPLGSPSRQRSLLASLRLRNPLRRKSTIVTPFQQDMEEDYELDEKQFFYENKESERWQILQKIEKFMKENSENGSLSELVDEIIRVYRELKYDNHMLNEKYENFLQNQTIKKTELEQLTKETDDIKRAMNIDDDHNLSNLENSFDLNNTGAENDFGRHLCNQEGTLNLLVAKQQRKDAEIELRRQIQKSQNFYCQMYMLGCSVIARFCKLVPLVKEIQEQNQNTGMVSMSIEENVLQVTRQIVTFVENDWKIGGPTKQKQDELTRRGTISTFSQNDSINSTPVLSQRHFTRGSSIFATNLLQVKDDHHKKGEKHSSRDSSPQRGSEFNYQKAPSIIDIIHSSIQTEDNKLCSQKISMSFLWVTLRGVVFDETLSFLQNEGALQKCQNFIEQIIESFKSSIIIWTFCSEDAFYRYLDQFYKNLLDSNNSSQQQHTPKQTQLLINGFKQIFLITETNSSEKEASVKLVKKEKIKQQTIEEEIQQRFGPLINNLQKLQDDVIISMNEKFHYLFENYKNVLQYLRESQNLIGCQLSSRFPDSYQYDLPNRAEDEIHYIRSTDNQFITGVQDQIVQKLQLTQMIEDNEEESLDFEEDAFVKQRKIEQENEAQKHQTLTGLMDLIKNKQIKKSQISKVNEVMSKRIREREKNENQTGNSVDESQFTQHLRMSIQTGKNINFFEELLQKDAASSAINLEQKKLPISTSLQKKKNNNQNSPSKNIETSLITNNNSTLFKKGGNTLQRHGSTTNQISKIASMASTSTLSSARTNLLTGVSSPHDFGGEKSARDVYTDLYDACDHTHGIKLRELAQSSMMLKKIDNLHKNLNEQNPDKNIQFLEETKREMIMLHREMSHHSSDYMKPTQAYQSRREHSLKVMKDIDQVKMERVAYGYSNLSSHRGSAPNIRNIATATHSRKGSREDSGIPELFVSQQNEQISRHVSIDQFEDGINYKSPYSSLSTRFYGSSQSNYGSDQFTLDKVLSLQTADDHEFLAQGSSKSFHSSASQTQRPRTMQKTYRLNYQDDKFYNDLHI